jgi:hypothetical protein
VQEAPSDKAKRQTEKIADAMNEVADEAGDLMEVSSEYGDE